MSANPTAGKPSPETRADTSMLAPFRISSYRCQWPADLATSWAFEMETIILGWYVIAETGSVFMLTLFASLQYIGTLIAPLLGMAGDRYGHRTVLCMMRAFYALLAVSMMALALSGALQPAYVLVIATLMGLVRPSDQVMRSSLIGASMPAAFWMRAMSISRTSVDSARIAGALAGALLATTLGMGRAYAVVAVLYGLSFVLTTRVKVQSAKVAHPTDKPSPWRDLKDGFAHVRNTPQLMGVMWLAFFVNLTAFPWINGLLPYVAKEVHGTGQAGLSLLVVSSAVGALFAAVFLARMGRRFPAARLMLVSSVCWHLMLMLFAWTPDPVLATVVLACSGFIQSLTMVVLSVVLLRCADERYRGRITGIRNFAIYGLPIGLMIAGPLITHIGYQATATLFCCTGIVLTLVIALRWKADLWSRQAPANAVAAAK